MSEDASRLPATYEVKHDPDAALRYLKAALRFYWKDWANSCGRWGATVACYCALAYCVASMLVGQKAEGLVWAMLVGFLLGVLMILLRIPDHLHKGSRASFGEEWTCTMTEQAWSARNKRGLLIEIPWDTMKLVFESPDGLRIFYGGQEIMVFRQPLRDAGLEEEFLRRAPRP